MARRKIATTSDYKTYWDSEWQEYQVEPVFGSVSDRRAGTYHTDDKQNAIDTMHDMQKWYNKGSTRPKELVTMVGKKGY
jgi:hypothetical protein